MCPIIASSGRVYAGASSVLIPPVTADDCVDYPSLEQLAKIEQQSGQGCTIRAGRGWARATPAELQVACGMKPFVAGFNRLARTATGENFFTKIGPAKFEVNLGAGWVLRGTTVWTDSMVTHFSPALPTGAYFRITNKYGIVSAAVLVT